MSNAKVVSVLSLLAIASCLPADTDRLPERDREPDFSREVEQARLERQRAESARYHFASDVQDGISDLTQQREEVRDGLNVKGYYSYSDGHFKRKVTYEADEKGYRIIRQEVEPLEGPQVNPDGRASVHTMAHGNELVYAIVGDDNLRRKRIQEKKLRDLEKTQEAI